MNSMNSTGPHTDGDLHDLLLNSEDITMFLQEFLSLLADRIPESAQPLWCAVSLLRKKKAATVVASSVQAEALDELQNKFTEGPCLTAMREHMVIRVGDVLDDPRWPDYLSLAAEQGVRSVLGVPFELNGEARAALNVYSDAPHDFTPEVIELIRHEVLQGSSALRLAVRLARYRDAEEDLRTAMSSRTVINLAAGIIMSQNGCSQEEAMGILRDASNHRNMKLRDVAQELVSPLDGAHATTYFEQ